MDRVKFSRCAGRFCRKSSMAGNMLIYILGSIFLIGILIVIVKGNLQEGIGIDAEKSSLLATRIKIYGSELERGVRTILQNNDYSERDIRFGNDVDTAYGLITDIPARQVFSPDGGAAEYKIPPNGSQVATANWIFNARNLAKEVGTDCATNACVEIMAILPNVTKDVCMRLNDLNGNTNPNGTPPKLSADFRTDVPYVGTPNYGGFVNTADNSLNGKSEGCAEGNTGSAATGLTGTYYYYRILLAR